MRKFLLLLPILAVVALPANAQTPKKKGSFIKRVGVALYKSPEATIYGLVNVAGAGVDVAERAVAGVHTFISKVDDVLDRAEQAINPAPAATPAPTQPGNS